MKNKMDREGEKKMKVNVFGKLVVGLGVLMGVSVGVLTGTTNAEAADMYRLYNPNSGEHFYTANTVERDKVRNAGWRYEGIGWNAPATGDPVYRVYNPNAGDHHYTLHLYEKNHLVSVGWRYEGVGWYSDKNKSVPLYRAYNPNAKAGSHNYTVNNNEQQNLLRAGWRNEGIAWYGVKNDNGGVTKPTPTTKYSFWYTAANAEHSSYNLKLGDRVYDSEAKAKEELTKYIKEMLMQGVSVSTSGVSPL